MKADLYEGAEWGPHLDSVSLVWRWRLSGDNGEPVASGQAYSRKEDAVHALEIITGREFDGHQWLEPPRGLIGPGWPVVVTPSKKSAEEILSDALAASEGHYEQEESP